MRRIARAELRVGGPLPWSCYDQGGRLLLRKGVVVAYEHQIDRLFERGLFVGDDDGGTGAPPSAGPPERVFERLISLAWGMRSLFNELHSKSPAPDAAERLRARARKIIDACATAPQIAMAAAHLDFQNPYPLAHHVQAAVVCALLGKRLGFDGAALMSVVCAALTCDVGLVEFSHLEKQAEPLDASQLECVRRHPERAASLLRRAGIEERDWLDILLQHHERLDGSGYPDGRTGADICMGARLLAVADSYAAMIRGRAFRAARTPFEAGQELLMHKNTLYDERICVALIEEFGPYPAGSIVRLSNGETAVVKESAEAQGTGVVMSVYDAKGMPLMTPVRREIASDTLTIRGPVPFGECHSASVIIRRLWL